MKIRLHFKNYIASPYWPQLDDIVNIQKHSGSNWSRSPEKKQKAIKDYLDTIGKTWDQYQELLMLSKRQWYRDESGEIIVPSHQLTSALVQASHDAPKTARIPSDQLRCFITLSDFSTGKHTADTVWDRMIQPKDGKGNPLSNQKIRTVNEVLNNFVAEGTCEYEDVKPETIMELFTHCGKRIGVGGSRKMGMGRFVLVK